MKILRKEDINNNPAIVPSGAFLYGIPNEKLKERATVNENLFLTNELFWYIKPSGSRSQFERLNKEMPSESKLAREQMGLMEYQEIEKIKEAVTAQQGEAGKCREEKVNTIVTITLNE